MDSGWLHPTNRLPIGRFYAAAVVLDHLRGTLGKAVCVRNCDRTFGRRLAHERFQPVLRRLVAAHRVGVDAERELGIGVARLVHSRYPWWPW